MPVPVHRKSDFAGAPKNHFSGAGAVRAGAPNLIKKGMMVYNIMTRFSCHPTLDQGSASGSRKSGFRDRDPEKRRRDGIGMGKLNPEIFGAGSG